MLLKKHHENIKDYIKPMIKTRKVKYAI